METSTSTATGTTTATGDRTMAAVAYILTIITGIIVFLIAKKEDKYARFHAIQAIGLGVVFIVVNMILGIITMAMFAGAAATGSPGGMALLGFGGGVLGMVWTVIVLLIVLFMAWKTYNGETIRIPVIADFADKNA